jgi:NDP-sugar pyrophosphorylase family protein
VEVGSGARIERSIIWQGSRIGDGSILRDTIVGMNYNVAPQSRLDGAIVANEPDVTPV